DGNHSEDRRQTEEDAGGTGGSCPSLTDGGEGAGEGASCPRVAGDQAGDDEESDQSGGTDADPFHRPPGTIDGDQAATRHARQCLNGGGPDEKWQRPQGEPEGDSLPVGG